MKRYGHSYLGIAHYGGLIVHDWVKTKMEEELVAAKKAAEVAALAAATAAAAASSRKRTTILSMNPFRKTEFNPLSAILAVGKNKLLDLKPRLPPGVRLALIPAAQVVPPEVEAARRRSYYMKMTDRCQIQSQFVVSAAGGRSHHQGAPLTAVQMNSSATSNSSSILGPACVKTRVSFRGEATVGFVE